MPRFRLLNRFRALTWNDRRLFGEAALLTAFVWVGLRTMRYAALRRALDILARTSVHSASDPTSGVAWAVQAASRRVPGGRTCLIEALTADVMLRRRGYQPVLHLGVRRHPDRAQPLTGHAWLVCNERIVVGTVVDLAEYTAMSTASGGSSA